MLASARAKVVVISYDPTRLLFVITVSTSAISAVPTIDLTYNALLIVVNVSANAYHWILVSEV